MDKPAEIAEPAITSWLSAYTEWFPKAIMDGHTNVNDAFRAGYLAALRDAKDGIHAE